jgi:hypothetical protein
MNKAHFYTPGSIALFGDSRLATGFCDTRMNLSDLRMHLVRSVSASLPVLTTIQTSMSTGYYQTPQGLVPRSTGESFLSWSCSFEDRASGKTLSGLSFAALPGHGQICGSHEESLSPVTGQSYGCRQDRVSEAYLSDWSGYRLH